MLQMPWSRVRFYDQRIPDPDIYLKNRKKASHPECSELSLMKTETPSLFLNKSRSKYQSLNLEPEIGRFAPSRVKGKKREFDRYKKLKK